MTLKRSFPIVALLLAFAAAVPAALAADEAISNTLTKQEISDGWILLFDGETAFGWKTEGAAKAEKGELLIGGEGQAQTTSQICCFELSFQFQVKGKNAAVIVAGESIELRPARRGSDGWRQALIRVDARNGKRQISTAFPRPGQAAERMRDLPEKEGVSRTPVAFKAPKGTELRLRTIKLHPIDMKSLFNGKDLTGWKEVPDHKSKFSVTAKGELNIKDGGGEIQTEGQWADFVLQMDVFSNGEHLNSGVFFRALPGQFWQGYEAQIRNEWEGYKGKEKKEAAQQDRTKPNDYGTGGIYGRQPSRKVVSNDFEWFTYTILADGPHIATWVNGYQTADYVDQAKDADSARKGRYLGKGAIGLQGHDPTTDLSFKNIKIQELPKGEKAE